jgi:hypothetical protein
MARKNKRNQFRKPQRGSSGGGRAARPAGIPPAAPTTPAEGGQAASAPQPATGTPVPRPLPRATRGRQAAGPLPTQDAAIPLERVPYFRSDLRRIAITAGFMLVLLIVGSIVLRGLLQA